ncbi:hypothetical protein [Enterobacter roggenkampii]|uniref:hypothetical protein n=1 Tax=Enterobacter roggenkampii TaxID=1812935 RepID=UPI00084C0D08|nr:hypothetical protein [Enterobacter roggenkampii]AOP96794.1 hypothetical protein BFV67_16895 [Enterobacter roggenkampii]MCK6875154.1 hypothetical protein [Enterobacter roggenkampii]MDX7479582.1 hypothetical protein [Enterobacter roggenkampii]QWZ74858.1 hypothetical protein I6L60_09760 [Enterobacter roggenkampii]RTO92967.1 hypothetical protein EKN49_15235 [Enterobacter roggenkampii]
MKKYYRILGEVQQLDNVANIYDELSSLDFTKSIFEQANKLDEDLFQLTFINGNIIDIGWYPAFEEDGEFIIQVISDENWDEPAFKASSSWDKNELIEKVNDALINCPSS